ncbi:hypothetical protein N7530_001657 [Penicillium desertorum]|uniref:Uncharacterized protein n=1 Tax=Penicillium desertorum TaxID=1303715 RepID=A0A9W9XAM6_9EURO|nr:hypothetical protein N7530_001657 [Penicillium desertorum]
MQLIDIWFSIHPFSVLVSKALLLQSIKDGVYDQAFAHYHPLRGDGHVGHPHARTNRPSLMVESATLVEWSMSQVCALAVNVSGHQHCPGPIAAELASFAPLSSSPSHV